MRIAFFVGVLGSDNDSIYNTIARNAVEARALGVHIPAANEYRQKMRELVETRAPIAQAQNKIEELRSAIFAGSEGCERIVLATPNFLGTAHQTFNGVVLPDGALRLSYLAQIFPEAEFEIFLCVMNPALFVPSVMQIGKARSYTFFLKGVEPSDIPWAEAVARLRRSVVQMRFHVWSNEDSLFLWGSVLRRIMGIPETAPVIGEYELLMPLLTPEGQNVLMADPRMGEPLGHAERMSLAIEYMSRFAEMSEVDVEVPLENWDQTFVDRVTSNYEVDLKRLAALEGIEYWYA